MDTLELIKTFREVARRGSFSMAAQTLDVSKANVSKYVAELESRLGVRLFNRSTRTVSLTDAGHLLLERSEPLVEMIELKDHPFFVGCQFHPEFKSRPMAPHPIFAGFVGASLERALSRGKNPSKSGEPAERPLN